MTDNLEKKDNSIDLSDKNSDEISGKLDLSKYDFVDMNHSDLRNVDEFIFKEGAHVDMSYTDIQSKKLDVSKCDKVRFIYADLSGVEELVFRDAEQMKRSHIDTAKTDGVNIKARNGDSLDISQITRQEHSEVKEPNDRLSDDGIFYRYAKENVIDLSDKNSDEISGKLDLSKYDFVDMNHSDLRNVDEFIFKEGAHVDMSYTDIQSKKLDVSKCQDVLFAYTDLSGVEELVFKDAEQKKRSRIETAQTDGVKIKIANRQVDVAALAMAKAKARGGK